MDSIDGQNIREAVTGETTASKITATTKTMIAPNDISARRMSLFPAAEVQLLPLRHPIHIDALVVLLVAQ